MGCGDTSQPILYWAVTGSMSYPMMKSSGNWISGALLGVATEARRITSPATAEDSALQPRVVLSRWHFILNDTL